MIPHKVSSNNGSLAAAINIRSKSKKFVLKAIYIYNIICNDTYVQDLSVGYCNDLIHRNSIEVIILIAEIMTHIYSTSSKKNMHRGLTGAW